MGKRFRDCGSGLGLGVIFLVLRVQGSRGLGFKFGASGFSGFGL